MADNFDRNSEGIGHRDSLASADNITAAVSYTANVSLFYVAGPGKKYAIRIHRAVGKKSDDTRAPQYRLRKFPKENHPLALVRQPEAS